MIAGEKDDVNVLKRYGKNFASIISAHAALSLGLNTKADKIDTLIKTYLNLVKEADLVFKKANSEMVKYDGLLFKDNTGNNVTMKDFRKVKEYLFSLKARNISRLSAIQLRDYLNEIDSLRANIAKTEEFAEQAFVDTVKNGIYNDAEITARLSYIERAIKDSIDPVIKAQNVTTGKHLRKTKDNLANAAVTMEYSEDTIRARASRDTVKKSK